MYWAVDLEGELGGPFPNTNAGRDQAMGILSSGDPYTWMGGWHHEGFEPRHSTTEICALAGVVEVPPEDLPVDLFPKPGSRYSRCQVEWMRDRFYGTVYRTKLTLK